MELRPIIKPKQLSRFNPRYLPSKKPLASKRICGFCTKPIFQEEGYTKNTGGTYHRKCWKQMIKESKE